MKVFAIILFVSIFSYPLNASYAERSGQVNANTDLSFVSSCTACDINGEISLFVALENESKFPIVVYGKLGWGAIGGLSINIEDNHGNRVHAQSLDDDIIVPSTLDDPRFYVTLFSYHALGLRRNFKAKELFSHPGEYTLWLSYRSPVPLSLSMKKENFISRESGEINSPKAIIIVTEHEN